MTIRRWAVRLVVLLIVPLALTAARAEGTFDIPPGATFDQAKLAKIADFFRDEIAAKKIPGAVLLIRHNGKDVYHQHFGLREVESSAPMTDKTIFRLHSMSKAVTSFVVMMLIDQGKLKLDDPLSKYIPAFADSKVGVEKTAADGSKSLDLVPLARPITIKDLLLHTSGITYGFYGDSLLRKTWGKSGLYASDIDNREFAEKVARLPLAEQPGTLWDYGHSTDVLGRVIEVVTGQSLYQFEKAALFDPLGMTDTAFFVEDSGELKRMAQPVPNDRDFRVGFSSTDVFRKRESGGGGLFSTMADFSRFIQMVYNGGELDGKRYLSEAAFKDMTTDHLGKDSGIARDYFYFPGDGFGFGYGFGIRTEAGNAKPPPPGSLGELKWDGASGCYFVIDPRQKMFFILLQQTPSERQRIQRTLKKLVYEALEK